MLKNLAAKSSHVWKHLSSKHCVTSKRTEMSVSTFVSRVSPITGRIEWIAQDDNYDYHQEIARSSYADMLHDTERNKKYHEALRMAINKMHDQGKKADVLDIGTGTGLLSMMAVSCGADSVVACEAFKPMANCARQIIKDNGMGDKIKIVPKRSTELTVGPGEDLENKANILVTEVFDTELIGEGGISTFHHAHKCLLETDCIVVPSAANMYVQVVCSDYVKRWNTFKPIKIPDKEDIRLPEDIASCKGAPGLHDLQLDQLDTEHFQPITNPVHVFRFDYSGKSPIEFKGRSVKKAPVLGSGGKCDALFMWWDLEMDTENKIPLSCAPRWSHPTPKDMQWRDHWMQAIFYPPTNATVQEKDEVTIFSFHDEYSLWFDVQKTNGGTNKDIEQPACTCGANLACSRPRIGQLNDTERTNKFIDALAKLIGPDDICLSINDGALIALIAARLGAKHVYAIELERMCNMMLKKYVQENNLQDKVTVLDKKPGDLSLVDLGGAQANVLLSEPYFYTSTLPWHNIFYWYARTDLSSLLVESPKLMPCCATMKAIAVDFKDLWKIRHPIANCEGFTLNSFDQLIEKSSTIADETVEPQPLWEYPGKPMTESFGLMCFDFTRPLQGLRTVERQGVIHFSSPGVCNGVAIWMDYFLDKKVIVTSGLTAPPKPEENLQWEVNNRQGVHLFRTPVNVPEVGNGTRLKYRVRFTPSSGEFDFDFSIVS